MDPRTRRRLGTTVLTTVAALVSCATFAAPAGAAPAATPHVGVVAGTVTGPVPGGAPVPVPGVRVLVTTVDVVDGFSTETTTAANGGYRLPAVPVWASYRVCFIAPAAAQSVSAAGFVSHCHGTTSPYPFGLNGTPVAVTEGRTSRIDDVLPAAAGVRGTVVDPAGRPAAGLAVRLDDGVDGAVAVTASDGTYAARGLLSTSANVCADPAGTPATATDPGGARTCVATATPPGAVTTVDVALVAGGGLRGRVVDPNGAPVAGAAIRLGSPGEIVSTVTNDDGRWTLAHLTAGHLEVCVTPPAGAAVLLSCTDLVVRAGRYDTAARTLAIAAVVSGTVTDTTGLPLGNVTATVRTFSDGAQVDVVTDQDGRYRAPGRVSGSGSVCFTARQDVLGGTSTNGYLPRCREGQPFTTGTNTVNVALAASTALSGRVTDDTGRGVGGAEVGAYPQTQSGPYTQVTTMTAADGRYVLRNVARGGYTVTADALDPGFGAPAGWVDDGTGSSDRDLVVGPRQLTGVDLALVRSAGVDVLVKGPSGEPLRNIEVRSQPVGDPNMYTPVATDADGRAHNAFPAGPTQVCAQAEDPRPGYPGGLAMTCATVTLRAGVVTRLTLTVPEAGA